VSDPVQQALLERVACARVDVLFREGVLGRGGALHVVGRLAVAGRGTAVEDARLVEMEMAFHEAWRYETACRIDTLAVAGEVRPDSGDTAARDGDIHACASASRALRKMKSKAMTTSLSSSIALQRE
jgi:hypothetical protein